MTVLQCPLCTPSLAQLLESDPAVRLSVAEALHQGLSAAERLHGPAFHAAMAHLDPALAGQVAAALSGGR